MILGKIIKFYREKAGLTQGQLGEGICSVTHLSKIERGITEYSGEITLLLAKKLNINPEDEMNRYHELSKRLNEWHEHMIMQRIHESETLKNELEEESLIHMPEFQLLYCMLSARYYLSVNQLDSAYKIIQGIQKNDTALSPHDHNMLKHILGIYYFLTGQYRDCISSLTSIDQDQYHHEEYYYHLAIAYHSIHSNITAYYYGKKALQYFQRTLNILRIIDTEMLLIIQLNSKELHDFFETKEKYEQLIKLCDACNSGDRKSKLYYNLGFEYFRRKKYPDSAALYKEALKLTDKNAPHYLTALDGYLHTCFKGSLESRATLIELAEKGLKQAKEMDSYTLINFQLHLHLLKDEEENYYQLIEESALPFFKKIGYGILIDHYERKLFHYYSKKGDDQKALELASSFIGKQKSYYDYD
ncbi:helix-turn-helix domain-containing protein [Bacillus sp. ISL-47]|uniref:helix-turn-helix domain-containing protein n=1 Tax=Bacillus sp. ISL-47 TaxID=2819130 RepID=UPI001BE89687|nr:helix-turn-helix domain-containing protein [Bacillus sp. ISL-47]MBT2690381.1 helix-turn-helix domain-containing protein [Bacillus sp. ISL-47]MBT2709169.1 helix-turn-helix domain-containing protein [Pseudomonas sp. ISL-84]